MNGFEKKFFIVEADSFYGFYNKFINLYLEHYSEPLSPGNSRHSFIINGLLEQSVSGNQQPISIINLLLLEYRRRKVELLLIESKSISEIKEIAVKSGCVNDLVSLLGMVEDKNKISAIEYENMV